ncbi:MAG TPA: TMEM43 family protein, partial [Roseomonas sp.]
MSGGDKDGGDGGSAWTKGGGWDAAGPDGGAKGWSQAAADEAGREGSVTETTHRSWFSRIGSAFGGMVFGIILIPLACWLLFWNEGRAVHTARALAEGAGSVISVNAERPDPANEGRLVHVSGAARFAGTLTDSDTGTSAPGAAVLRRRVEMFQWREQSDSSTSTNLGGSQTTRTTYSYSRAWSDTAIDSSRFRQGEGRSNPRMPLGQRSLLAQGGRLGGFALGEAELRSLSAGVPLPPATPPAVIAGRPARIAGQEIYVGQDPANPVIGDLRITYTVAQPETLSVIARQTGPGFAPYATRNGETLHMVSAGARPAREMIQAAEGENNLIAWALRLLGVIGVFAGFALILQPVRVLADVIPIFGQIAGVGIGLVSGMLALLVAPAV